MSDFKRAHQEPSDCRPWRYRAGLTPLTTAALSSTPPHSYDPSPAHPAPAISPGPSSAPWYWCCSSPSPSGPSSSLPFASPSALHLAIRYPCPLAPLSSLLVRANTKSDPSYHMNGLSRQYIPKQPEFAFISHLELLFITNRINHQPRICLDFMTPFDVFFEHPVALDS